MQNARQTFAKKALECFNVFETLVVQGGSGWSAWPGTRPRPERGLARNTAQA